jgi:ketosteroid isomerase-like protein
LSPAGRLAGVTSVVGDRPPGAVAQLYAHAARGDLKEAVRGFTPHATYSFGTDESDERGARAVAQGHAEIAAAVGVDLTGRIPRLLVCVRQGPDCLVEGKLVDSGGRHVATFAASFQLDDGGGIARAVTYRTTPVQPSTSWAHAPVATAADARHALERYLSLLEGGDFEGAAHCFAADVVYAYPQAEPGAPRPVYVGRSELLGAFVERGRRAWRHRLLTSVQRGRDCIAEGDVLGLEAGRTGGWISSLTLDDDGLISRYCTFYAEPALPRWGDRPPSSRAAAFQSAYNELK